MMDRSMEGARQILLARSRSCAEPKAVLVVEDDDDLREMVLDVLWSHGYAATGAENGSDALAQLRAAPIKPRCVLLDLFMPVMDGWQLIDQLRADGRLDKTQIVIITSAPHRAPAGLPVFQKPLDLDKVMTTVQRLC